MIEFQIDPMIEIGVADAKYRLADALTHGLW